MRIPALALVAVALAGPAFTQSLDARQHGNLPDAGARCAPEPLAVPAYDGEFDLAPWQGCGSEAWPFAQAYSPAGDRLYVTLFGGTIGNGGCTVARLDPDTRQVVATITTGESPEELAFVTWPDGSLRYGFVSDSSSSTVTVFDASDAVVATVSIPFDPSGPYPTAFPTGLAVAPDQQRVHVATGNGEGWVHAIDVASLSLDPAYAVDMGRDHSAWRIAFAGERLVIPAGRLHPNFTGSTAKVLVHEPGQPGPPDELVLASADDGMHFPSPSDLAVDCAGRVWVAGFDLGARVLAVDPAGPTLLGTIPTFTSNPDGKFQALGLSADGLLVAGDLWTDELSVIDVRSGTWLATVDGGQLPAVHRGPQEVVFDERRGEMVVSWAGTDDLSWFDL